MFMSREQELTVLAQNISILYVEDDDSTRQEFEKIFQLFFKEVLTAENGQHALEIYQNRKVDLVVTDLTMPKMDGIALIRAIFEMHPTQHIVVITAHNTGENLKDSIDHQIDGILIKPLDLDRLLQLLLKVCRAIDLEHKNAFISSHCKKRYGLFNSLDVEKNDIVSMAVIDRYDNIVKKFGSEVKHYLHEAVQAHLALFGVSQEASLWKNDIFLFVVKQEYLEDFLLDLKHLNEEYKHVPVKIDELIFNITLSFGIVNFKQQACSINEKEENLIFNILSTASEIRKGGRKNFVVHQDVDICNILRKEEVENLDTTLNALKEKNIVPFFQPVVDCNTLKISAYEIFARIEKNGQYILPATFIDISESSGLLEELSEIVFEKSFEKMSLTDFSFHINITDLLFKDARLKEYLPLLSHRFNIPSSRVILNINNDSLIQPDCRAFESLLQLKEMGYKIALKEFANDIFSIDVLSRLKPDYIRFNQHIIQKSLLNSNLKEIIFFLLQYAKHANIKTILEGVENERALEESREFVFDYMQGYYIKKPMNGLGVLS
jgi:EAL domain-containing protein (putative c-di-GMP-specific phosphodiesterase class I)/CheY-like chemotaxis protein